MPEMRPFTKDDWKTFPGAEGDSYIGEGDNYVVLVSSAGVDVFLSEDVPYASGAGYLFQCAPNMAKVVAKGLPKKLDKSKLIELGFRAL